MSFRFKHGQNPVEALWQEERRSTSIASRQKCFRLLLSSLDGGVIGMVTEFHALHRRLAWTVISLPSIRLARA